MMLENCSLKELKNLCKQKGLYSYQYIWTNRSDLVRLLNSLEEPKEQEKLKQTVAKIVKKNDKETKS